MLWMNTVGPYHNRQETYNYFSLPFCKGEKTTISHYHEGLADAIQGVELEFSGLDIAFKGLTLTNQALYMHFSIGVLYTFGVKWPLLFVLKMFTMT